MDTIESTLDSADALTVLTVYCYELCARGNSAGYIPRRVRLELTALACTVELAGVIRPMLIGARAAFAVVSNDVIRPTRFAGCVVYDPAVPYNLLHVSWSDAAKYRSLFYDATSIWAVCHRAGL